MAFFSLKKHIIKNLSTEKKGKREALNTVNYIRSSKKIQKTKKCAKAREKNEKSTSIECEKLR